MFVGVSFDGKIMLVMMHSMLKYVCEEISESLLIMKNRNVFCSKGVAEICVV